jgi:hypothetical protein
LALKASQTVSADGAIFVAGSLRSFENEPTSGTNTQKLLKVGVRIIKPV